MNTKATRDDSQLVLSYMGLRKMIGYIGVGLPFALAVGRMLLTWNDQNYPGSMSGYYYTPMRDVFVGSLCAIGVSMFSYCGYDIRDKIAGRLACAFAIGVAVFPVRPDENFTAGQEMIGRVHLASATLLFATLAYFCLGLFTQTHANRSMTIEKRRRNSVYKVCGWIIIAAILLIALSEWLFLNPYSPFIASAVKDYTPVYWLEAAAVVAFGVSWLTKGEAILADDR